MASDGLEPQEDGAALTSVAITIQLLVLAVAFVIGRALERIRFQWMGEAGAGLLLGLFVGLILKAAGVGAKLAAAVAFKGGIFFYILLPIIMFDAGYSLDTRMFIRNVGSLSLYAFVGTTISCFVVGLMMWGFGQWGWCYSMPLLANLTFGALISATDPVTVLAVFQRLNAQPDLYTNVFGESVLNDAVGMVLYNVMASFLDGKDVNAASVFAGIGMFVGIFLGSTAIGLVIGLLAAAIFRSRYFYSGPVLIQGSLDSGSMGAMEATSPGSNSTFEVGLAVVFAYGSYLVADAAHCSGIVAVVVNGMVMNMYVRPNLSEAAQHKIETLFKTLAGLFELFVFCYIGSTMFLQDEEFNIGGYTALSLIALAVSRAANILPCTALVNWLRPLERHISPAQQFMLWWSGLRGAMAFALSVEADDRFGQYGKVMKTCTFYLIFITVLVNGGTCAFLLRRLGLRAEDTPALILRLQDSLAHMHGFGSADCVPGTTAATTTITATATAAIKANNGVAPEGEANLGTDGRRRPVDDGVSDFIAAGKGGEGQRQEEEEEEEEDRLLDPWEEKSSAGARSTLSTFPRGLRSFRRPRPLAALPSPKVLLEKVRSLNDGRLVDRFDEFDRRVSKLLIHPDALREAIDLSLMTTTPSESTANTINTNGGASGAAAAGGAAASVGSFRAGLAAKHRYGGGGGSHDMGGSHEAPQTLSPLHLSPSPSQKDMAGGAVAAGAGRAAGTAGIADVGQSLSAAAVADGGSLGSFSLRPLLTTGGLEKGGGAASEGGDGSGRGRGGGSGSLLGLSGAGRSAVDGVGAPGLALPRLPAQQQEPQKGGPYSPLVTGAAVGFPPLAAGPSGGSSSSAAASSLSTPVAGTVVVAEVVAAAVLETDAAGGRSRG